MCVCMVLSENSGSTHKLLKAIEFRELRLQMNDWHAIFKGDNNKECQLLQLHT